MLTKFPISVKILLGYVGISESTYYYKYKKGKRGAKPSTTTNHKSKGLVSEKELISEIKELLSHEFIDCGYHIMTKYLQRQGYEINHKKVYRLMGKYNLLKKESRISRNSEGKKYVRFRKVKTDAPMDCLEMDIKMVWIPNIGKNAYLLSVIDVHTRKILGYRFGLNMKQEQVIELLSDIIGKFGMTEMMVIRSDNGSQFIANEVRKYISLVGISQEFTHVATPEENAHIEAYHGTLKRDLFDRIDYTNFGEIEQIIARYVEFYNTKRLHGLLGKITPEEKWEQDKSKMKIKIEKQVS